MNKQTTPWVEKYRPDTFNNIVLEKYNKMLLENIISKDTFPNLLLYGPPGTGKTTTIINLIQSYQRKHNCVDQSLVIHLNASDERGIDTIRNNINAFVNSKSLFKKGMKFVILDEVDYMTKNAQQALKYLLQINNENIRFCLICNYISRIDESLQNQFMRLRFNQLPEKKVINFLQIINKSENLNYSTKILKFIQKIYKSDVRSMINYMQSNQNITLNNIVIKKSLWKNITNIIIYKNKPSYLYNKLYNISFKYNIEIKNIIKYYFNYIIQNNNNITKELLNIIEFVIHQNDFNNTYNIYYIYYSLNKLFNESNELNNFTESNGSNESDGSDRSDVCHDSGESDECHDSGESDECHDSGCSHESD